MLLGLFIIMLRWKFFMFVISVNKINVLVNNVDLEILFFSLIKYIKFEVFIYL